MIDPSLRQRAHEVLSWLLNSVDPADWPGKVPEIQELDDWHPMAQRASYEVICDLETVCYVPHVEDPVSGSTSLAEALADAGPVIRDLLAALDSRAPVPPGESP